MPAICLAGLLVLAACQDGGKLSDDRAIANATPVTTTIPAPVAGRTAPTASSDESPTALLPRTAKVFRGTGVFVHSAAPIPQAGGDAEAQPGDTTLNFVDVDVQEVVASILGDVLHLSYTIDPSVQAKITVQTSRPIRRDAVLPVLVQLLHASGLALVEASGIYRVIPADDAARSGAVPVRVSPTGAPLASNIPTYNIHILPLKYASAGDILRTVQPFVPKGDLLQADTTRNLVIISGAAPDLATLSQLMESFDVNSMAGMSFAIVPLEFGSAKPITDELKNMFGPQGSVPMTGMLRFEPLEGMNAVLVISPQAIYIDQARTWIERLDNGEEDNTPRLFEYHVQNSRAADLARVLSSLFGSGEVRTIQPQTAPGTTETEIGGSQAASSTGQGTALNTGQSSGLGLPPPPIGTGSSPLSALPSSGMGLSSIGGAAGRPTAPALSGGQAALPESAPGGTAENSNSGQNRLQLPAVRIVADEKNNTLVIFTTPRTYRMIDAALKKIDIVPLQVLIEATVAEVTLTDDLQFGLQWFVQRGNNALGFSNATPFAATAATGFAPAIASVFPGFNYVFSTGNANTVLSALSAVTNVHVLSSPQLLVLDHGTANLEVGDEVPIPTAQIQSTLTAGAPVVNTIQYVNTGVILHVSPRVNVSGLITLDITQEVSAPVTTSTSSLNGPTIQQRRVESSVVVQDGETIALGGLIQDTKSSSKNGIPLLSNIPVLGALFSTSDHSDQRTELLILLSPKVVHNAQETRDVTRELRRRLHDFGQTINP